MQRTDSGIDIVIQYKCSIWYFSSVITSNDVIQPLLYLILKEDMIHMNNDLINKIKKYILFLQRGHMHGNMSYKETNYIKRTITDTNIAT